MVSTSFRKVLCCMQHKYLAKGLFLLLNLCIIEFGSMIEFGKMIDKDHLEKYPYCGSMHYTGSEYTTASSRAVNAKEDYEKWYRWLVVLKRENMDRNGVLTTSTSTGSVITER